MLNAPLPMLEETLYQVYFMTGNNHDVRKSSRFSNLCTTSMAGCFKADSTNSHFARQFFKLHQRGKNFASGLTLRFFHFSDDMVKNTP